MFLNFSGSKQLEMLSYAICGAVATMTDIIILSGFEFYQICFYQISAALAFISAMTVKYLLCSVLILKHYQRRKRYQESLLFLFIGLIGLGINQLIIMSFSEEQLFWSKSLSIVVVVAWNYLSQKMLLFNKLKQINR